jgi:hypothetical protein
LNIREPELSASIYFSLSIIEEKEDDYEEALKYFKQYHKCEADNNQSKALLKLNEKSDFDKLKIENSKLVIKHQRTAIISSIIILLIALVAFFFYKRWVKSNDMLSELNQKMETLKNMVAIYQSEKEKEMEKQSEMEKEKEKGNEFVRDLFIKHFDIMRKVVVLENYINTASKENGRVLLKKFNTIIYGSEMVNFEPLYDAMNQVRDGFYEKIRAKYVISKKRMNEHEFHVCCLSCENFSDIEISIILKMSVGMIRKRRRKIRKTFEILEAGNIYTFFIKDMQE